MALQISTRESGDVSILDLRGRATIGVDSDLLIGHLDKLVATGVLKLLLNLADVTQLDSSGISAIVGTSVSLRRQGGSLKLLCPCGESGLCCGWSACRRSSRPLRMRPKL